jgi:hypothetical protein
MIFPPLPCLLGLSMPWPAVVPEGGKEGGREVRREGGREVRRVETAAAWMEPG